MIPVRPLLAALLLAAGPAAAQEGYWFAKDTVVLGYVGANPLVPDAFAMQPSSGFTIPLRWGLAQDGGPQRLAGCAFAWDERSGLVRANACPAQMVVDIWTDGNESTYHVKRVLALGHPGEVADFGEP